MGRRGMMRWGQAIVAGIVMTWGARASAEDGYIDLLQTALLPSATKVDQPFSCAPCHASPNGGNSSPNLLPFGELLFQNGIGTNSQASDFVRIVDQIKTDDPKVYMDLTNGLDPNPDVGVTVHTPEFGCDVAKAAGRGGSLMSAAFALVPIAVWRRRARVARRLGCRRDQPARA